MNWRLILWFAGFLATIGGLKFVWTFMREMFSKENFECWIDTGNEKLKSAAHNMSDRMKERKERKRAEKEGKTVVYKILGKVR